ncbi:MAG: hypothetical protein QM817_14220 [Archangium sp.]
MSDRELRDELEQLDAELKRLSAPAEPVEPKLAAIAAQTEELTKRTGQLTTDTKDATELVSKLSSELSAVRSQIAHEQTLPVLTPNSQFDDLVTREERARLFLGFVAIAVVVAAVAIAWLMS